MNEAVRGSEQIVKGPEGTRFFEIRRFPSLVSTNAYLVAQGKAGAPEGLVVVADYQQKGRGRLDRRWVASPGSSILLSLLLRPPPELFKVWLLGASAALAARRACSKVAGVEVGLKWPNDLLISERKAGGILVESEVRSSSSTLLEFAVVGIGINVACPTSLQEAPADGVDLSMVGWLEQMTEEAIDHEQLIKELLIAYEEIYSLACSPEARAVEEEYRLHCTTLGKEVTVHTMQGELRGLATDIDEDGRLLVEMANGVARAVAVGDVVHLR
ncbi:MAG: biotin--[acetyl-CoA-carboxylase] ligase [Actinobacteria bacterium]|nr:biotin--[acetyl-CoA-carboxylase] ligase [Actinomycetota bacterium]MCL6095847.1 biotin--[acetyl-CoA-carboxylase] ligase [Actinomycetota bacterium]